MKQEFDREMDSLLRGALGGARVVSPRPADGAAAHLSADELSAFAENALPPAARARYTSHIADCDQCRRVVAGITLAAGPSVVREERAPVPAIAPEASERGRSWLATWAGALLSPGVLRFALPVLAVALVGVVGLVVMRNRGGGENTRQIAQQTPADVQNKTSITEPARPSDTSTAPASPAANMATGVGNYARAGTNTAGERPGPLTAASPAKEGAGAKLAPVLKDGQVTDALTAESPNVVRNEAKQAAPPKPDEVAADRAAPGAPVASVTAPASARPRAVSREADEADKRKGGEEVAKAEEREEQRRDAGGRQQAGETRSGPSRNMEGLAGSRRKSRDEDDDKSEYKVQSERRGAVGGRAATPDDERRSVAGREFRRRGGEWVGVKYRDGMTTLSYRRGSEGFRALVADIPEVGRVAEQLQGTVVVVVRGRAYRIH